VVQGAIGGFEMKGERFIAEVKNLAELDGDAEAKKATRATLEMLKERWPATSPPTSPHSSRRR
jgi:uncharacterized protein (DUF2267 family)